MKIHPQTHDALRQLAQRIESRRIAMLTLRAADGRLSTRPMTLQEMDAAGGLWMLASRQALQPLFDTMQQLPAVLAVSDEESARYVSVIGHVRLLDDAARKAELWSVMARPWFSGADDPDLTLLALQPAEIEIWDGPANRALRLAAIGVSVAAGHPVGLGGHERMAAAPPRGEPT